MRSIRRHRDVALWNGGRHLGIDARRHHSDIRRCDRRLFPQPQDAALAQIQLHAQMLRLIFAQIRHGYRRVRCTAGRVNVDRAHAEQTLQKRSVLVNRLNALVGHMDALLVEDTRVKAEFLVADLVPQMLVRPPLVQQTQPEDNDDASRYGQPSNEKPETPFFPGGLFEHKARDRGKRRDRNGENDDARNTQGTQPDVAVVDAMLLGSHLARWRNRRLGRWLRCRRLSSGILRNRAGPFEGSLTVHHTSSCAMRASSAALSRS